MELWMLVGTALTLGVLHSLEPDHVAAVSSFVVRRPTRRAALGYGLRWALGHGGVVLLAGSAILLLQLNVAEDGGAWLEKVVGASLVLLGGWVLATARTLHAHQHVHEDGTVHAHLHAHPLPASAPGEPHPREHRHRHAATAFGALHGLAGTAPVVALIPVTSVDSPAAGIVYLLAFGVGTAMAMALYAMFAGVLVHQAASYSGGVARGLSRVAGVATAAVGVFWLVR
ncbi:MAG TPA: sulfite exporter TauE/SafE family protein [Longimicrobiales bacterium]|nr:sulfite exporter TauE/SafE family protein [Longimicrobiales bacterium]